VITYVFEGLTVGQVGGRFEGDLMGGDASAWPGLLASAIGQAHAAVAQPGGLERTVHLSFGDTLGREYVLQLTADLAVHGWDLARATGQHDTLDPGAVALLLPWAEANAELLTASGMFGTRISTGPGAPDDVRLLGLLGRRAWPPRAGARSRRTARWVSTRGQHAGRLRDDSDRGARCSVEDTTYRVAGWA
jgi:uncharacterized protein (TIGR03086 family)